MFSSSNYVNWSVLFLQSYNIPTYIPILSTSVTFFFSRKIHQGHINNILRTLFEDFITFDFLNFKHEFKIVDFLMHFCQI